MRLGRSIAGIDRQRKRLDHRQTQLRSPAQLLLLLIQRRAVPAADAVRDNHSGGSHQNQRHDDTEDGWRSRNQPQSPGADNQHGCRHDRKPPVPRHCSHRWIQQGFKDDTFNKPAGPLAPHAPLAGPARYPRDVPAAIPDRSVPGGWPA
jgi:hypothetical protein